jgi:hypothetical protein
MNWMSWILYIPIPLLVCVYTVNFGRWLLRQDNRFGGMFVMALGVAAFVIPMLVILSKQ